MRVRSHLRRLKKFVGWPRPSPPPLALSLSRGSGVDQRQHQLQQTERIHTFSHYRSEIIDVRTESHLTTAQVSQSQLRPYQTLWTPRDFSLAV